jgi:hypothetical protein
VPQPTAVVYFPSMAPKKTTLKEIGEILAYVVKHMATKDDIARLDKLDAKTDSVDAARIGYFASSPRSRSATLIDPSQHPRLGSLTPSLLQFLSCSHDARIVTRHCRPPCSMGIGAYSMDVTAPVHLMRSSQTSTPTMVIGMLDRNDSKHRSASPPLT